MVDFNEKGVPTKYFDITKDMYEWSDDKYQILWLPKT